MPRPAGTGKLQRQIGARIRALREESGKTQEKLAWICNLSKAYLSQVESGKRLPTIAVLVEVSKALKVNLVDLLVLDLTDDRLRFLEAARRGDRVEARAALRALGLG